MVEAADPEAAVNHGSRLRREKTAFLLVADLGMPTSGGTSFQGGFEVVKRFGKMNIHPPVLMMTESLKPALHLRAKQMGVSSFVFKPGLAKLNPKQFEADMHAFAKKLLADVLPKLTKPAAPAAPRPTTEPGAIPTPRAAPSAEEMAEQMSSLQRRLTELRGPGNADPDPAMLGVFMKVARKRSVKKRQNAHSLRITPRQQRRPRRAANRRRRMKIRQPHPFFCHLVEIGRLPLV